MHKHIYWTLSFVMLFAVSCSNALNDKPSNNKPSKTDQKLSLNGNWKFNTFLGDGSNYRDISPTHNDIIIDNSNTELLVINGNWELSTTAERESRFWGSNYLTRYFKDVDLSKNVQFHYPKLTTGYYEHFIYYPFKVSLHSKINIKHLEGTTTRYISQRNRPGHWISLGIFKLDSAQDPYIEVTGIDKRSVAVDAVMLRPISQFAFLQAEKNKKSAHLVTTQDHNWHNLKVPGHWGMINQYSTYTGKGWYRKAFKTPSDWQAKPNEKLRLTFDGVYHIANVYLNGQYLGRHQGGFTPFEFDVTNKVNFKENNILAVEADNSAIVGATWNWGGIIRDVTLIKNEDVRIKYQYIHAEPDLESGTAKLTVRVRVENSAKIDRKLTFNAHVNKEEILTHLEHNFSVPANSIQEFELTSQLNKQQVKLWHFDRPHLYNLQSTISENGKILHSSKERFGIRKISLTDSQMLLNGEPVRIGGYNRISDHRYWGSSEPLELLEQDIDLMKNAGANFMRIMHGTQNKKLIELCDEKGILIFEEANIRELTNPEFVAPEYTMNKQWIREMIERDINHPSIIGWSVGNELTDHYIYAKKMINYVKSELDPYRLVTSVSNTGYLKNDSPENDPLGFSDLMMQNIYQKDPEQVITTITERWPNKPLFISEYGLGRFSNASLDNDYTNFAQWHEMIRGRNTHVIGTSQWSFNDYRSGYSQTLEEENRAWGLITNWRKKRRAYTTFQQELSPVKSLTLANINKNTGYAKVNILVRDIQDYPSYTMDGYHLEWQIKDIQGNVIDKNTILLPTLTPQSKLWEGSIQWNSNKGKAHELLVQVLSTNGYTRSTHTHVFNLPSTPKIKAVITGDKTFRVIFDKEFSGKEYYVKYRTKTGEVSITPKTINNHIDVTNLDSNQLYQVELIAINALGESKPSNSVTVSPNGKSLPPIIWEAMSRDNKLIVGFSGAAGDDSYQVRYGYQKDMLNLNETTTSRGMITANIAPKTQQIFFQLKRINQGSESKWSIIRRVNVN